MVRKIRYSKRGFLVSLSNPIAFGIFAFLYSFIGILSPQHIHLHEYSLTELAKEAGGHIAFGLLATFPLWILDFELFFLSGGVAILLDSDHILGALNLAVSSRPDHSIVFFIASTFFTYALARKTGKPKLNALKIAAIVPAALLSHLSYDVFAAVAIFHGAGYAFPLFVPFTFSLIQMPYYSWVLFELGAASLTLAALLTLGRRSLHDPKKSMGRASSITSIFGLYSSLCLLLGEGAHGRIVLARYKC